MGLLSVSLVAKLRGWTSYSLKSLLAVISWSLRHLCFTYSQTSPNHPISSSCDCTNPVASPPWKKSQPVERLSLDHWYFSTTESDAGTKPPPSDFTFTLRWYAYITECTHAHNYIRPPQVLIFIIILIYNNIHCVMFYMLFVYIYI